MFVFTEGGDRTLADSSSLRDIQASTRAATMVGARVVHIPADFSACDGADNALWSVPAAPEPTPAIWIGFLPDLARYRDLYDAARQRQLMLPNDPDQHQRAMEFDKAYPALRDLTPESVIIDELSSLDEVHQLGFPVFLKGAVQSVKASGWRACVAHNEPELRTIWSALMARPMKSRGRVIARRLLQLRHNRVAPNGFPLGREYRVFVYHQEVVAMGYYWEGTDTLAPLSASEEEAVSRLAVEAARRLDVPYLSVDIGQDEDNRWWVIEVGDAQFAGLSQTPPFALWNGLFHRTRA